MSNQNEIEKSLTNSYKSRLLGYIRDNNLAFSNFTKEFDSYICSAGGVLTYTCDSHNKPAQFINSNTDLVYLERIINKLGISLDYFPSDYLNYNALTVNGIWKWNNTLNITKNIIQKVDFSTDIRNYNSIEIKYTPYSETLQYYLGDTLYLVYAHNKGPEEEYFWVGHKEIDFGDNPVLVSEDFYNFIHENATPTTEQMSKNITQLKTLYLTAIRGVVVNRAGNASRITLKNALQVMYPTATIEIHDGGVEPGLSTMNIQVNLKGYSSTVSNAILSLYLKQNITGVQEVFNFDVSNVAVFAPIPPEYRVDGTKCTVSMEVENFSELDTIFSDVETTKPYNYSFENKYGTGSYLFMNYDSIEDKEITENENEKVYLNTGYWLISLI